MTFLVMGASSCSTVTQKLICKQLKENEIKPLRLCDVSFKFSRCRCRDFDFNTWKALSKSVNYPIEDCEGISGFFIEDHADEIRPKIMAIAQMKKDFCK